MKKIFKLIGIIAIVAVIGFSMTACPVPPEPDKEGDPDLTGTITISPNANVTTGTELTATYSGSQTVSYQWKKDGSNVGTNSNKFTPTEAGSYTVTVSATGFKSKTSPAVTVTGGSTDPGNSDWVAVTNSTFGTSDIRGIANGNGKFVAVGADGKMATSTDGETWTATNVTGIFDSADRIDSIAYGNNMFVAVSYNTSTYDSKIATSTDGVTWTAVTTPPSGTDRIFYGNGKFIAVGTYKTAASTDGVTWTAWSYNSSISISSIAYGNDKFVAVGSGPGTGGGITSYCKVATSTDGETWTNVDVTFGEGYINSIAYGNGTFVAGLNNGRMATSTDGTTWTIVANSTFAAVGVIGKIIYGNNTFVAVGLDMVNSSMVSKVVTSPDGTTWTAANVTSIFVDPGSLNVAYGGGKFVIVGRSGKMAYLSVQSTEDPDLPGTITISPNTNVTLGMELTATYSGTEIVSYQWKKGATNVGTDADTFTPTEVGSYTVTVSATGYKSKTSNPVTVAKPAWTLAANSTFGTTYINGIAYGKGTFVAVGGASKMAYSSDGKNWTAIPPGLDSGTTFGTANGGTIITGIAYGNNTFVAVGLAGKMATSPDGRTWTKVANNSAVFNNEPIIAIAYGNNMFVAVGADGIIGTSSDGRTWTKATQSTFVTDEYIEAIAYGKGTFVAVGDSGKIVTSTNGTTWTGVTNSTFGSSTDGSSHILSITYKNGIFIIGGVNGKMATSTNGTTWTTVDTGTIFDYDFNGTTIKSAITAIAYGNGMFVAGGGSGTRATSPDGTTWTAVTDNLFDRSGIDAIAFGDNMFVAAGGDGKMAYLYVPPVENIELDGTIAISPTENVITGMELTAKYTGAEDVSYQWKKDGSNVGTDSNKFTPTEAGSYTVTVSAVGYNPKTSAAVTVTLFTPAGLYASAPPITNISTLLSSVAANDVAAAVTYIKANPGTYTLIIDQDINCAPQTLDVANVKLTIIGIGEERQIKLSINGNFFTVGAAGQTGIEFTIGNNVTLVGRSVGGNGNENNTLNVVYVGDNGSFTMLEGSKITGNTTLAGSSVEAAVLVDGTNPSFTMNGGTITGNKTLATSSIARGGGLNLRANTATVKLNGGSIIGNEGPTADVWSNGNFTLSGNMTIGELSIPLALNGSIYSTACVIKIADNWTGSVGRLNLRGVGNVLADIPEQWSNIKIIEGADGYSLKTTDLAKFNNAYFYTATGASNQPIANTHKIENSGENIGKLIRTGFTAAPVLAPLVSGNNKLSYSFTASVPAADSYDVYYKQGIDLTAAQIKTGTKITGALTSGGTITGLTNDSEYCVVVVANKEGITGNTDSNAVKAIPEFILNPGLYASAPPITSATEPTRVISVAANNVAAAVTYIKANPGTYTLIIDQDINCAPQTLDIANVKLTIIGNGVERQIKLSSNGNLFTVGATGQTGIEFTIGNNVTLVGRSVGGNGNENNTLNVVYVGDNGSFTMLEGSKITGNTTQAGSSVEAAVLVDGNNPSFTMNGGTITENKTLYVSTISRGGGLNLRSNTATVKLNGGSIIGNEGPTADVWSNGNFTLSGNMTIGELTTTLAFNNSIYSTSCVIKIANNWTGSVGRLNMRGVDNVLADIPEQWSNIKIIEGADGYSLKTTDLAKFNNAYFYTATGASNQPIANTHKIENSGANIGKLIRTVFSSAPVLTLTPGDAKLTYTWTASAPVADSYDVYWKAGSSLSAAEVKTGTRITGATSGGVISGLTNGTAYSVIVVANKNGFTVNTDSAVQTATPAAALFTTAPTLTLAAGNAKLTYTWTASNPAADSYDVYWKAGSGLSAAEVKTGTKITGATSGGEITGLTNGTAYSVIVVANKAGYTSIDSTVKTATPVDAIYGVTLSQTGTYTFPTVNFGSSTPTALSVTVTNTGNRATGTLTVALSGTDANIFARSPTSISSIAVGGTDTFTVRPSTGYVGTYTATVTVSREEYGISATFNVSFTVNADPNAPYIITGSGSSFTATRNGASIGTGGAIQAVINAIRTNAAGNARTIQFGNGTTALDIGTATASFNNTGGAWTNPVTLSGKLTGNGNNTSNGTVYIDGAVSVTSTAEIANTSLYFSSAIYHNSTGTLTISGGTVSSTTDSVYNNSTGTVNISGGTVSATTGYAVYNNSTGAVNISGGTVSATTGYAVYNNSTGKITVSQAAGATTTVTSANNTSSQGTIYLKSSGTATAVRLEITGGTVSNTEVGANQGAGVAVYNDSTGAVIISGGTVSALSGIAVYNAATGKITVSEAAGATTTVTSANSSKSEGTIYLKSSGTATAARLEITGGTVSNTYNGASQTASPRAVYNDSTGAVIISGGTVSALSGITCGAVYNASTGAVTVSGGTVSATGYNSRAVYNASTGTVTITAGTISATGTSGAVSIYNNSTGVVTITKPPAVITGSTSGTIIYN